MTKAKVYKAPSITIATDDDKGKKYRPKASKLHADGSKSLFYFR